MQMSDIIAKISQRNQAIPDEVCLTAKPGVGLRLSELKKRKAQGRRFGS